MTQEIKTTEEINKEDKYISIDDFAKVEIMLGTIKSVAVVEGSDKLYKLLVDFGEYTEIESESGVTQREEKYRTVFSGIRKYVTPQELLDAQFPFVTNLAPRKMMGEYSEAMILAGSELVGDGDEAREVLALMSPTSRLSNGVKLR